MKRLVEDIGCDSAVGGPQLLANLWIRIKFYPSSGKFWSVSRSKDQLTLMIGDCK